MSAQTMAQMQDAADDILAERERAVAAERMACVAACNERVAMWAELLLLAGSKCSREAFAAAAVQREQEARKIAAAIRARGEA